MNNKTATCIFAVILITTASLASAATISLPDVKEIEQMQAVAINEASKTLLRVEKPLLGKDNMAVVRVDTSTQNSGNYCLVLLRKLMVPGADKGIWISEKKECK